MQKKIVALAVAGLVSGASYAQTNLTVYGIMDMSYTYSKMGDAKFSGMQSGGWDGPRIGFQGEETLGNGLKTIFTMEFGADEDNGTGLANTRLAFVGLSGKFGQVTLGKQNAPSNLYLSGSNSNEVVSVYPTDLMLGNSYIFSTMSTGDTARWDNSIAYTMPSVAGFDGRVIYSFGEQVRDSYSDASTNASKFGIGGSYSNGGLYLTAIWQQILDNNGRGPTGIKYDEKGSKSWAVGGAYDFKVVKIYANYIQEKFDGAAPLNAAENDKKHKLWSAGVSVPVSAVGTIRAEYMQFKADELNKNKAKGYGIGYDHQFSKRTWIYTAYSHIDNDKNMGWGYTTPDGDLAGLNSGGGFKFAGDDADSFQIGIRHGF